MAEKRMLDLVDRLLSVVDGVEWKYDDSTDGYYVALDSHYVEIKSVDRDGRHPFGLVVINKPNVVLESLLSNEEDLPAEYVERLETLYTKARQAEKNLDGALDTIFSQLPEGDVDS